MEQATNHRKPSTKTKILLAALAIFAAFILVVTAYLCDVYRADGTALACMATATEVDGTIVFASEDPIAGMVFYPGGKVEPESYAPLMQKLAENKILSVLVPMPANLAVFGMDKADGIIEDYPEVENWYMAGHSLGGSMAASYIADHASDFDGLILLAAYSTEDLTATDLCVLSIYGDCDGVLNLESYEAYKSNLPNDFSEVILEGGCHAYFGSYGEQDGDGTSSITRDEQIEKTVEAILAVVE